MSEFGYLHVCPCIYCDPSIIRNFFFLESQNDGLGWWQNGKDLETGQKPGSGQAFPEGLGKKTQTERQAGWPVPGSVIQLGGVRSWGSQEVQGGCPEGWERVTRGRGDCSLEGEAEIGWSP